jgi:hypothetical protein
VTGFLNADGAALGGPVGVVINKTGGVGNTVWRVTSARQ